MSTAAAAANRPSPSTSRPQVQSASNSTSSQRPHSLSELAARAKEDVHWDPSLKVTHWLRCAEEYRANAQEADRDADVERTFLELAKSTEILHRLREHPGYRTYLNETQRSVMSKNAENMLDKMYQLKSEIVTRYDQWKASRPSASQQQQDNDLEAQKLARKLARDNSRAQTEADDTQRREEISKKDTEVRDAREEQFRRRAELDREREKEKETKYSKASDSAAASAMQEAAREQERRMQIRLELERQQQQRSSGSIASAGGGVRRSDDDVVLVGGDHSRKYSSVNIPVEPSPGGRGSSGVSPNNSIMTKGSSSSAERRASTMPSSAQGHAPGSGGGVTRQPTLILEDRSSYPRSSFLGGPTASQRSSPSKPTEGGSSGDEKVFFNTQNSITRQNTLIIENQAQGSHSASSLKHASLPPSASYISTSARQTLSRHTSLPPEPSSLAFGIHNHSHNGSTQAPVSRQNSLDTPATESSLTIARHNSNSRGYTARQHTMPSISESTSLQVPNALSGTQTMPPKTGVHNDSRTRDKEKQWASASASASKGGGDVNPMSLRPDPVSGTGADSRDLRGGSYPLSAGQNAMNGGQLLPSTGNSSAVSSATRGPVDDRNEFMPRRPSVSNVFATQFNAAASSRTVIDDRKESLSTTDMVRRPSMSTEVPARSQQQSSVHARPGPVEDRRGAQPLSRTYTQSQLPPTAAATGATRGMPSVSADRPQIKNGNPTQSTQVLTQPSGSLPYSSGMSSASAYAERQREFLKKQKRAANASHEYHAYPGREGVVPSPPTPMQTLAAPPSSLGLDFGDGTRKQSAGHSPVSNLNTPDLMAIQLETEQMRWQAEQIEHRMTPQKPREEQQHSIEKQEGEAKGKDPDRGKMPATPSRHDAGTKEQGGQHNLADEITLPRVRKPAKLLSDAGDEDPPVLDGVSDAVAGPSGYAAPFREGIRPGAGFTNYDSSSSESWSARPPTPRRNGNEFLPTLSLQSPRRWLADESSADEAGRKLPPLPRDITRPPRGSNDDREQASVAGPPPMTTTSPRTPIPYTAVMDEHQKSQGYTPSLHSTIVVPKPQELNPPSVLFSNRPAEFREQNLNPQNPWPRRPGKPSQMPVHLMDPKSQLEAARVRHVDPQRDRIKPELRQVDVPSDVLKRFVAVSAANTELNKETLGLLMGKYKSNKYVVTTLLIPRQRSSSEWCLMEDEETVLQFQEKRFLVTLGWIHTHPTQSCFMSSCDLHSHAPYQKMLPEAFAIVCAPQKEPNYGIFRLTDPPGLQYILECVSPGMFHPHDVPHLYTDCDKSHVSLIDGIGLEICDIRHSLDIA